MRNGERSSAARAYLYPILAQRPNLKVTTEAYATRIIFEGKRAVGIEYRQGHEVRRVIATPLSEAANEDLFWNPLWLVAVGMAGLFVILACLTSS